MNWLTARRNVSRKHWMSKLKLLVGAMVLLFSVSGCAKDRSMSPPQQGEKVSVIIKAPNELEPSTMHVMYRSAVCPRITRDGYGRHKPIDGHNGFDVMLKRSKNDIYETELYIDGGGPCRWRLSNVSFGVQYRVPTPFGEDVMPGGGGALVIVFDKNNPQRRVASPITVSGEVLDVVEDYYPLISEQFIGGYRRYVSFVGVGGGDLRYNAPQARNIYFEPVLHREYIVKSIAPKKHVLGDFTKYYYPDGTVKSDSRSEANFAKMQEIRLKAEAKK
jgi:hypothetical protein